MLAYTALSNQSKLHYTNTWITCCKNEQLWQWNYKNKTGTHLLNIRVLKSMFIDVFDWNCGDNGKLGRSSKVAATGK